MFSISQMVKNAPKVFRHNDEEYWDAIPHSRGTTVPSSWIRQVNGEFYQYWPIDKLPGIWIKIPNITTYENKEEDEEDGKQKDFDACFTHKTR